MSALFEKMVAELRGKAESEQLNAQIKGYYDNLTPTQREEDRAWGQLGEQAVASLVDEDDSSSGPERAHRARR